MKLILQKYKKKKLRSKFTTLNIVSSSQGKLNGGNSEFPTLVHFFFCAASYFHFIAMKRDAMFFVYFFSSFYTTPTTLNSSLTQFKTKWQRNHNGKIYDSSHISKKGIENDIFLCFFIIFVVVFFFCFFLSELKMKKRSKVKMNKSKMTTELKMK